MFEHWVIAFIVATVVALFATPVIARIATPKRGSQRVPVATALAVVAATLLGALVVIAHADTKLVVGIVTALWLAYAGQLTENGLLPKVVRWVTIPAAAVALTFGGLRLEVTGTAATDYVATVLLVWLAISAWRSAPTRDNLLLCWGIVIVAGAGIAGGLSGQLAVAGIAAATVGACIGFFPYVVPPIAARLRAGGAQFLGCMVVVLALDAHVQIAPPAAAIVPLLFLTLPLVDALLVIAARLRDHDADAMDAGLPGRWRVLGVSRLAMVIGLTLVQAGLAFVGVCVARTLIAPEWGVLIALAAAVMLGLPALLVRGKWTDKRFPKFVLWIAGGVIAVALLLAVPAGIAMWRARSEANAAADAIQRGLDAVRTGDTATATAEFDAAATHFEEAKRRLSDPFVSLGERLPVVGPNLLTARELTDIGADLSRTGGQLTTTANPQQLKIVNATVDIAELRRLEPELEATTAQLQATQQRVRAIDRDFLVPQLDDAIGKLDAALRRSVREGQTVTLAAKVLPAVLGGDGDRRYILAMQNPAEARATGGIFGNWAELTAVNGKLALGARGKSDALYAAPDTGRVLNAPADYVARYARFAPDRFWQNVNVSPDLPTVGAVAVDVWNQAGRPPVNGVIAADSVALAEILRITGPITVPQWPVPITADNVVDITLKQAYVRFANDNQARDDFLGDVTQASWDAFSSRDLGSPATLLKALGNAVREKHIMLWLAKPAEEQLVRRAGAAGAFPRHTSDLLMVTTQNSAANKLDTYLERAMSYTATLTPTGDGQTAVKGAVDVTLANNAPGGLPLYVQGPNADGLAAGDNRTFVSVYTPLTLSGALVDGSATATESATELNRNVFSSYQQLRPGDKRELTLFVAGEEAVGSGGWYELSVPHQPGLQPTPTRITLRLADGWRFAQARGGMKLNHNARRAIFDGAVDRDLTLRLKIERDYGSGLWGRLQAGSNR
jgi:Protein of unknown function (DUF4012)